KADLNGQLQSLLVAFKHGTFTDKTFSLLEIQIKQIQSQILELSTKAVVETPKPQNEDILKALRESNSKLLKLI
ncbi:hypothetical protein ACI3PL_25065, partial [Lacticaseibacillus paracasei]